MPSCEPSARRALASSWLPGVPVPAMLTTLIRGRLPRDAAGDRIESPFWSLIIAAPTFSWVASSRLNSATSRPWRMTRMRSLIPRTSGSSLEIIRMPSPCWASSLRSRWISALAPTSTPRVGSSTISSLGLLASHLPTTTFCWLPPESLLTTCSPLVAMMLRRRIISAPMRRSDERSTTPKRVSVPRIGHRDVLADAHLADQALRAAVLGNVGDAQLHGLAGRVDASPSGRR